MRNLILSFLFLSWAGGGCAALAREPGTVSLDAKVCARMAREHARKTGHAATSQEAALNAQDRYYRYLMNQDMMPMMKDVKENFEKAVDKAEERFDNEDVSISQADILKLRLGLIGSQKDLNETRQAMARAEVELREYLGLDRTTGIRFPKKGLVRIILDIPSLEDCLEIARRHGSSLSSSRIELAHINLLDAGNNVRFLKKGRKYSRGLMVVALANFDMGIGEGRELFEALYIYNRSVRDYVKGVYRFNMAVARLNSAIGLDLEHRKDAGKKNSK